MNAPCHRPCWRVPVLALSQLVVTALAVRSAPPTDIVTSPSFPVVAPDAPAGTTVATLSSVDPDAGDTHSYFVATRFLTTPLIPANSTWKYWDGNSEPAGWRGSGFDDASWASGDAVLGYGDAQPTTVSDAADTVYFRRTFTLSNLAKLWSLNFGVLRDDGAVIYINGVEAFRSNMPLGPITHATFASGDTFSETIYYSVSITDFASLNLVEGENTIAVSVHQASANNGDLSFDLRLETFHRDAFDNALFRADGNRIRIIDANTAPEGETFTINVRSTDSQSERYEELVTITSTSNPSAPITSDQTFSVDENTLVGTVVGTVPGSDPDGVTFAIVGGNTGESFAIHPDTGVIKVDEENPPGLDFETTPTFDLVVDVTDRNPSPLTRTITVTIDVNDLNERPVIAPIADMYLDPTAPAGTEIGTFQVTDEDAGTVLTYEVSFFEPDVPIRIDPLTGTLYVSNPAAIDPATWGYGLWVSATDNGDPALRTSDYQRVIIATELVGDSSMARFSAATTGTDDLDWFEPGFDDATWSSGVSGFGYDNPLADPNYLGLIRTNVGSEMAGITSSFYARYVFNIGDTERVGRLFLRMLYEDGFVAYLNGAEVARSNVPDTVLNWQSTAAGTRAPEDIVYTPRVFDISAFRDALVNGTNVLALRGLNADSDSSDFLLAPQLVSTYFGSPSFPTGARFALGPAEIVTRTSVRIPIEVIDTGGSDPELLLSWGTEPHPSFERWQHSMILGSFGRGSYKAILTELEVGTTYYYHLTGTNAHTRSWLEPLSFQTLATPMPTVTPLVSESAALKFKVPTDASEDDTWTDFVFSDSTWGDGQNGVGYESGSGTGYAPYISTDVGSEMEDRQTSVYLRIPFTPPAAADIDRLRLYARYDDAFVAYLNGTRILSVGVSRFLDHGWDAFAEAEHEAGTEYEQFDVTQRGLPRLAEGQLNVLAIHAMNRTLSSLDMLIQFGLEGDGFSSANATEPPSLIATPPSDVTPNSVSVNGNISDLGGEPQAEVVLVYGEVFGGLNPMLWENHVDLGAFGAGAFSAPVTGLKPNTTYFYSFYAYNAAGLSPSTTSEAFITGQVVPATVSTLAETVIDDDTVQLNGSLGANGGDLNTMVIFAWGDDDAGAVRGAWDNQINLGNQPPGVVQYVLDDIAPNSTVFYRVFAVNAAGTASGASESFATATRAPVVEAASASSVAGTSATLNGHLVSDGGEPATVVFHWGTEDGTNDPQAWQNAVDLGVLPGGGFSTNISNLTPSRQYFFTVSAENARGRTWAPSSRMFFAGQTIRLDIGASATYLVPGDNSFDTTWYQTQFDDSAWSTGATGIGYDTDSDYRPLINTGIVAEMYDVDRTSAYVRIDFDLALSNPGTLGGLVLNMKHDDGFVAYLNGVEVARDRTTAASPLAFDESADSTRADALLAEFEAFDISDAIGLLVTGNNVLAIHGLNASPTSSDFVVVPQIITLMDPIPSGSGYGTWIAGYPSLAGAAAATTADPDLDGIINLLEYAFGGDPTVPARSSGGFALLPAVLVVADNGGSYLEMIYRRRTDFAERGMTYMIETSSSLEPGNWMTSAAFTQQGAAIPAGDGSTEFVRFRSNTPIVSAEQFGRVRVSGN